MLLVESVRPPCNLCVVTGRIALFYFYNIVKSGNIVAVLRDKHVIGRLGDYELNNISLFELQKFVTELIEHGNLLTGKGLSVNSVNGIIAVVQNSLKLVF